MIKIEKTDVFGWEAAIRGMRNPMNSWEMSDSVRECDCEFPDAECSNHGNGFCVGTKDFDLMKRLVKCGSEHSKFMRMIHVQMDVTAPLYWWSEYDTYKVGTVANSCSTMHKIHAKEFRREDFSWEHLYAEFVRSLDDTIAMLNIARDHYLETKEKDYWWSMIQLLPSSYNQRRTLDLNYAVLRTIYHQRKNHKLDEWHDFCHWIESLPYSELITMEG